MTSTQITHVFDQSCFTTTSLSHQNHWYTTSENTKHIDLYNQTKQNLYQNYYNYTNSIYSAQFNLKIKNKRGCFVKLVEHD